MKNYLPLLIILFLTSCFRTQPEENTNPCYEREHLVTPSPFQFFDMPFTISPHKRDYRIGDTIIMEFKVSNQIYNRNFDETLVVENFPFDPYIFLYHFDKTLPAMDIEGFNDGFQVVGLDIDEIYNPIYAPSSRYADRMRFDFKYENELYHFKMQLVLNKQGRYILLCTDAINSYRDEEKEEIISFQFEGKCEDYWVGVEYEVSGDNNLTWFRKELEYIDNNIRFGNWYSSEDEFLTNGNDKIALEKNGVFCFEVKE